MDNSRTHDKDEVQAIAQSFGLEAIFLPPYAFMLTPLDNGAFGKVVLYLRGRHNKVLSQAASDTDVRAALDDAFLSAVSPAGAMECFSQCGYAPPHVCPY